MFIELAAKRGYDTRIGLEDTLVLPDGTRARDNAELWPRRGALSVSRSLNASIAGVGIRLELMGRFGQRLPCGGLCACALGDWTCSVFGSLADESERGN